MPEKNQKQKTTSPQIYDVAKPGKFTPADATSRPVIVTNRAIMRDPMMASGAANGTVESAESRPATAAKVIIKPLTGTEPAEETAAETDSIVNISVKSPDFTQDDASTDGAEKKPAAEPISLQPLAETRRAIDSEPKQEEPADEPGTEPAKGSDTSAGGTNDAGLPDTAQAGKAAAAEEAAIKQQEELEQLVEKKQYFLPVNSVEKRRSLLTTIFGLMVIIILGLLLLNLMLDAGFIQVNGLKPFTHFFNNS